MNNGSTSLTMPANMMVQEVYNILQRQCEFISTKELAWQLRMKSDRALRGHGKEIGLLDAASRWIFEKHGKVIVSRMSSPSGVRLSNEPEEIRLAIEQWESFHWHVAERVKHYKKAVELIRRRRKIGVVRVVKCEQLELLNQK